MKYTSIQRSLCFELVLLQYTTSPLEVTYCSFKGTLYLVQVSGFGHELCLVVLTFASPPVFNNVSEGFGVNLFVALILCVTLGIVHSDVNSL